MRTNTSQTNKILVSPFLMEKEHFRLVKDAIGKSGETLASFLRRSALEKAREILNQAA